MPLKRQSAWTATAAEMLRYRRYVPVDAHCGPQRGPEAASGAVHANVNWSRLYRYASNKAGTFVNSSLLPAPLPQKHMASSLTITDLPAVHCVNC